MTQPTVGVVLITHRAKHHLPHCLPPLLSCPLKPRVLVVNSSSADGTVELAEELGAETLVIPRSQFNHGSTRERARQHLNTDIVVMMTPDAYAISASMLCHLIEPIANGRASISYGRQVAHDGAGLFERFPREFNYPTTSHVRGIEDLRKYGIYTFFCSDACAAYSNNALSEIGGFPSVLLGEDTMVTAQLLNKGHKIAYVAEAVVQHSHRYSLSQEFRRHFDTGLARRQHQATIQAGSRDEARGAAYAAALMKKVAIERPLALPYAGLHCLTKWLGYRLGRACIHAPTAIKRAFSSQDFYWSSDDFKKTGTDRLSP